MLLFVFWHDSYLSVSVSVTVSVTVTVTVIESVSRSLLGRTNFGKANAGATSGRRTEVNELSLEYCIVLVLVLVYL